MLNGDLNKSKELNSSKDLSKKKTNNKICYLLISFHSGICTLSDLAVQYFFKDQLKLEPGYMSQILSICLIPWMIKPLFGIITDLFPIFGYRRKIYILFCGILDIICWLYMAFFVQTLLQAVIALFLVNVAVAFSSVLAEAIVVELSKLDEAEKSFEASDNDNSNDNDFEQKDTKAKDLISMFLILKDIGILASSYLKGLFVDIMNLKTIFLISAFTPLLIIIGGLYFVDSRCEEKCDENLNSSQMVLNKSNNQNNQADNELIELINTNHIKLNSNSKEQELNKNEKFLYKENHETNQKNLSKNNIEPISNIGKNDIITLNENKENFNRSKLIKNLWNFIFTKEILIPLFFMIVITSTPSYDDPLFYFLTNQLKFSGNIMGQISLASSVTAIIAVIAYKIWFKRLKFKSLIIIGSVFYFIFSYSAYLLATRINLLWGISDHLLCLFSSSAISMIGEFLGMPLLSLACIKSPKYLEGTVYSFFMSALNLGEIVSYQIGAILTNYFKITSNDFKNLPKLISICNILGLLPVFIFMLFDEKYFEENSENKINKENNANDIEKETKQENDIESKLNKSLTIKDYNSIEHGKIISN